MQYGSEYKLLSPGTYQWDSPMISSVTAVDIRPNYVELGPYRLVTVPKGEVAVTNDGGELRILGYEGKGAGVPEERNMTNQLSRTFFLDNAKWEYEGLLSVSKQTDPLPQLDIMSKEHLALLIKSMSEWCIVDPYLAVEKGGRTMLQISSKVNDLVRASISRIVAGTTIGSEPVSASIAHPVQTGKVVSANDDERTDRQQPAQFRSLQSEIATTCKAEMSAHLSDMGIEVLGIYAPEIHFKNDDTRQKVVDASMIGRVALIRQAAADAEYYADLKKAQAQAETIRLIAEAHKAADEMIGQPGSITAQLALIRETGRALSSTSSSVTFFQDKVANLEKMMLIPNNHCTMSSLS